MFVVKNNSLSAQNTKINTWKIYHLIGVNTEDMAEINYEYLEQIKHEYFSHENKTNLGYFYFTLGGQNFRFIAKKIPRS